MRKFLTISAAVLLFPLCVFAQGGIPLLDKVPGHRVHFHYTYSLSQGSEDFSPVTDGDVTLEDNAYILKGLGLEVRSDGVTRWTLDAAGRELLVETIQKEDLFTNPALFIASYKDYMDRIKVNAAGDDSLDLTLTLDNNTRARFLLNGISFGDREGKSDFSLDEKSLTYRDYVVTDLR